MSLYLLVSLFFLVVFWVAKASHPGLVAGPNVVTLSLLPHPIEISFLYHCWCWKTCRISLKSFLTMTAQFPPAWFVFSGWCIISSTWLWLVNDCPQLELYSWTPHLWRHLESQGGDMNGSREVSVWQCSTLQDSVWNCRVFLLCHLMTGLRTLDINLNIKIYFPSIDPSEVMLGIFKPYEHIWILKNIGCVKLNLNLWLDPPHAHGWKTFFWRPRK